MALAFSPTEVQLPYGGDFSLTATGDLQLVQGDAAIIQRILQLIQTNYRQLVPLPPNADPKLFITDNNGNQILRADDLFHPEYGTSVPRLVGQLPTIGLLNEIQSRIVNGILTDPGVMFSPLPTVSVTNNGAGATVINSITVTTVSGQYLPVPTDTLQNFS